MSDEEPVRKRPRKGAAVSPAPTTPDPIEIAMKAEASGKTPTGEASVLLRRQAVLIDEQIDLAKQQVGLARNERFRNRIRAVRDIALAAVAMMLAVGVGAMIWNARQASGLVIQPLSIPPDLAERGLTGSALASQLLDRLTLLQASTNSARPASTYENNWEGDVSVEIPSTGVSIDELGRWLRRELGNETLISGEVFRDGDALIMTVRAGAEGARATRVEDGDLERLIQASAEAIYEQTQPYRYASYLRYTGRSEEGRVVATRLIASSSPTDRAWSNVFLGNLLGGTGDLSGAILYQRRALEILPNMALAQNNLANYYGALGDDERGLAAARSAERNLLKRGKAELDANAAAMLLLVNQSKVAADLGDPGGAAALDARRATLDEYGFYLASAPLERARHLALAHDSSGAWRTLRDAGVTDAAEGQRRRVFLVRPLAPTALAHANVANWEAAARDFETIDGVAAGQVDVSTSRSTSVWPYWAEALGRSGRIAEAEALIARTPEDCYPCLAARGVIASLRGNAVASDRWFARALRKAPSIPAAYSAWGEAKLARGDIDGAITLFRQAAEKGPRWADPLKFWGDALLAQGDERGAIRRYREAADRAPRWGGLHLAWGRAVEAEGQHDQALVKYRVAAGMDLSAADRAEVVRRLAGVSARP